MIDTPPMMAGQLASWHGLLDLAEEWGTDNWCLVGGQLVHLHCWERGVSPNRTTNDADTVVDVRGATGALTGITQALTGLDFTAGAPNGGGKEYRWTRGEHAIIDVLVPSNTNDKVRGNVTVNHRQTIEAPGTQQALDRSELIELRVGGRVGFIPRPTLLGALVGKASAATEILVDDGAGRHSEDFAVLSSLVGRRDLAPDDLRKKDQKRLRAMIDKMGHDRASWVHIEGSEEGIARIGRALDSRLDTTNRD